jgi:hypothetical protein
MPEAYYKTTLEPILAQPFATLSPSQLAERHSRHVIQVIPGPRLLLSSLFWQERGSFLWYAQWAKAVHG